MSEAYLRRYTDLPALIYMLNEQKITLLDPKSWDDQNDAYYLALYKEKKNLSSVLAVCFTQASETYHHWRVFASSSSGVRVRFRKSVLLAAIKCQPGVIARTVKYPRLTEIQDQHLRIQELPFLKRYAFEDEEEFRLIYESKSQTHAKLDIPISLSCINRIVLSPWMHPSLASHVKKTIRAIKGCSRLDIIRSTLLGNVEWKRSGDIAI